MSSSVTVLAPNGRRQIVRCTANTTILQILEEVCHKQGFKPDDYDIKHHNKVLDTTISFRFSGLPNNAQLELATATKARLDSEVILAVNLESGDRIVGNFLPDETIYSVLENLCPDDVQPHKNPVVIYMRNEIYGDNLRQTTLRNLGLRGGRAMVRLVHRLPDELRTQANVSSPLPAKVVEEKPYRHFKTDAVETKANAVQKKTEVDIVKLAREKRKIDFSPVKATESAQAPKNKQKVERKEEVMEVDDSTDTEKNVEIEENFVFLGERNAMLFSLESAQAVPSEDLPDDFFELTIDDAKKILGEIRKRRQNMENGALMTAAMRNLEESKKQLRQLHKYKHSVIRVQFPNRTILQGTFKPTETIQDVSDFVRNYLQDRTRPFYLYTTPPKNILPEQNRLMEVGCVPGALLHLGTDTSLSDGICLKEELKDKFTTNSMASLAASKVRKQGTRPEVETEMEQNDSTETLSDINVPGPSSQPTSYERKIIKSTEKVPKWFKPSK